MNDSTKAVFLSYASQDAEAARRIGAALRAAGIEVWLDQSELRGGDAWDSAIRSQIASCALFLPIISANTRARVEGYFRLEWKLAVDRSHLIAAERPFLLPVVIDGTHEADALVPQRFREVQWTPCPGGQPPAAFIDRLVQLLAPGSGATGSGATAAGPSRTATPPGTMAPTRQPGAARGRGWLIGLALTALIGLGAGVAYHWLPRGPAIGLVAVLPFDNPAGDPAIEYLSDGISESLINKLSSVHGLHVISRTSAFAFKEHKLAPLEIGRRLGVDAVITGSLAQRGQRLAITAELVSVRDATQLWGDKYARQADDMQAIEGEIAATIAATLRRQLSGEEKARLTRAQTSDAEAYRLYLRGVDFLIGNQQEMDRSIDYFQQAIARAPDYAMAYAGLADAYTIQAFLRASSRAEAVDRARAAVTRALELDPELGEAHAALGLVRSYFDWDWAGADGEFRRALALSPGSQAVHEAYGGFLTMMLRLDDGLAQSREAARLDPLSVQPVHDMAINALVRGHFDAAAAGFRHTIDIDPNWTWGYIKLARTLSMQHHCKDAFAQAEIAERRIAGGAAPLSRAWLGVTYATCGDPARARQKLAELHALEARQYVDPVTFADIDVALGDTEAALALYERALADRSPNMAGALLMAQIVPVLGHNPRYVSILERMRFPAPPK